MSPSTSDRERLINQIRAKTADKPSSVVLTIAPTRVQKRLVRGAKPGEKDEMIDFAVGEMKRRGYRVTNVNRGLALNPSTAMFELEPQAVEATTPAARVVKCPHCGQLIQG